MSGLVAVTFTEKAAGELKLRLRQELESARAAPLPVDERRRSRPRSRSLEEAQIGTIHGFCADLLKEYPVEAGVDPLFVVLTEDQARRRYDEAFASWFQAALEEMPEGVRRSLRRSSRPGAGGDADADGPVDRLRTAGWNLTEWRDFPASWTRPEFERAAEIDRLTTCVRTFAAITREASSLRDPLFLDTAPARRASDELPMLIDGRRSRRRRGAADRPVPRPRVPPRPQGLRPELRQGPHARRHLRGAAGAGPAARHLQARRRCRSGRAAARRVARQPGSLRGAEGAPRRAGLLRSAAPRTQPGARARRRCARSSSRGVPASSSTSSRTPIRCRPSSCCC